MSDIDLKKLRWKAEVLSGMRNDEIGAPVLALLDRLEAAERERDELRKDAERYRFLEENGMLHGQFFEDGVSGWAVYRRDAAAHVVAAYNGADLGEAIDASMSKERGGAETPNRPPESGVITGDKGGAGVLRGHPCAQEGEV